MGQPNKFKITLFNENQYTKKEVIGKVVKYTTASKIYNEFTGSHTSPHHFKSNDTFSVTNDSRIRLISFYGNEIYSVVYNDGTVRNDIIGEYERVN